MQRKESVTYQINIYLSGPILEAEQAIRAECKREGLCVTISPTKYIYTGGEETGYVVGLLNYPRYPSTPERLWERAELLAILLRDRTHQNSVLIVSPEKSVWVSDREES